MRACRGSKARRCCFVLRTKCSFIIQFAITADNFDATDRRCHNPQIYLRSISDGGVEYQERGVGNDACLKVAWKRKEPFFKTQTDQCIRLFPSIVHLSTERFWSIWQRGLIISSLVCHIWHWSFRLMTPDFGLNRICSTWKLRRYQSFRLSGKTYDSVSTTV